MSWMLRVVGSAMVLGLSLQPVGAAEPKSGKTAVCKEAATSGKNGAPVFSGTAFFLVATEIEGQGKGNLRPAYDEPKSLCEAGTFLSNDFSVMASYAGFEPGMQTLLYRFLAKKGEESREILVLYNGTISLIQGSGPHFYVSETIGGRTNLYAMYNNEPGYGVLKSLVEEILDGGAEPLMAVEWPDNSDELAVVVFSERLN